jgi:hypothetical protein
MEDEGIKTLGKLIVTIGFAHQTAKLMKVL